jgi:class 3 adenylate cyclase/tetratricopeptide (TPR) repeat protein
MSACPLCARESPAEFAFCPACGTKLAPEQPQLRGSQALTEERKVVTTLFCDLVSYTAHSEASDHELIDALLQRYNALAKRLVEGHGGVVEKFIGDAVLAVFGFPRAHDDDAERAVRCALKLATEAGGPAWPDGDPVQVRIGVNSGETYLHTDVDPASGETFLTGDAVNTAARLETAAPPGGIVVGELTHLLTDKTISYEELEPLVLKGKGEPVPAWLAKGVREDRSRTGLRTTGKLDTPFLGRLSELRSLEAALDAAVSTGRAQFRLLVGEPGIGKSRLILEFARALDEQPDLITWRQGRCLPFGEGVAFWALGEIVKVHAGILDSDDVVTVEEKLEVVLPEGEQRPWFRQRLRPLLGLEGAQVSREEAFAAWTQFLAHLAAAGPAVVVLEDLHWAGEGMLAFVEHLTSQELGVPLLVVGTARPELLTKHPDALKPAAGVGHLVLTPLSRREASRLVSALLDERLAIDVRAPIIERVGGNPLYAEEYVRLLLDRGLLIRTKGALRLKEGEQLPLPDTVQAVLAARLDTLPPEYKALLCDAAVFGESFWGGGVAALAHRASDEVIEAMALLAERQLVRPTVSSTLEGESEYLFWHALARDVAYEQIPRKARARKHEEAALWIEATAGERASDHAEVLAHHYVTSLDLAKALRDATLADRLRVPAGLHLARAGEKTLRLDVAVALGYYETALELLPADVPERARAVYYMAEALFWQGRRQEAIAAYEEAAESYLSAGDRNMAALSTIELAELLYNECDPRLFEVFEQGLALLDEEQPSRALVWALSEAAGMNLGLHGLDAGIETAERALEVGRRLGLPDSPYALEWRACALAEGGDFTGALREYRRAIEEGELQGIGGEVCRIHHNRAMVLGLWEGPEHALGPVRENIELARRTGMEFWELSGLCRMVDLLVDLGRWDEALLAAREVEPRILASGCAEQLLGLRLSVALVATLRGDDAVGQVSLQWLEHHARPEGMLPDDRASFIAMMAVCRSMQGRLDEAHALLVDCLCLGEPVESFRGLLGWLPFFVQASLACGDLELAVRFGSAHEARMPRDEVSASLVSAMLAEARGERDAAAGSYATAAARAQDLATPYEEAQALLGQGRCLVALGRAREAVPLLGRAHEIFARLGAKPALAEVDRLAPS